MDEQNMKPIIMNVDEVRGVLSGLKTMKRVPIKNQDGIHPRWNTIGWLGWEDGHDYKLRQPYQPGDVLWVRETFARHTKGITYKADSDRRKIEILKGFWEPPLHMPREAARLFLLVKDVRVERVQDISENDAIREGIMHTDFGMNWDMGKMSIDGGKTFHEIEPIHYPGYHSGVVVSPDYCFSTARRAFANLWDARNAKRGYGWDSNPWTWVIEFEECDKH